MVFFFWKCLIQGNQTVRIFSLVSLVLACSFCRFLHRVDVTKAIFFLSLMQFTLYQHTLSLSVLYPLIHSSKVVDLTTIFLLLAHKLTSVDCSRKKNTSDIYLIHQLCKCKQQQHFYIITEFSTVVCCITHQ